VKTSGQGTIAFAAPPDRLARILPVGTIAGCSPGCGQPGRAARLYLLTAIATE
jgi:hypothetical protein